MPTYNNFLELLLDPFILELSTLKGKPILVQIEVIESLADQNRAVGILVSEEISKRFKNSIFTVELPADDKRVVIIALLSVLMSDIATIPSIVARKPYIDVFNELCDHFNVYPVDVSLMSQFLTSTYKSNEPL